MGGRGTGQGGSTAGRACEMIVGMDTDDDLETPTPASSPLTVARMMVLVALVGAALGAWAWVERRRSDFRWQAYQHDEKYRHYALRATGLTNVVEPYDHMMSAYHRAMMEKYKNAARWPWCPVVPDWPEPRPDDVPQFRIPAWKL
jgi:hypothetical protein